MHPVFLSGQVYNLVAMVMKRPHPRCSLGVAVFAERRRRRARVDRELRVGPPQQTR